MSEKIRGYFSKKLFLENASEEELQEHRFLINCYGYSWVDESDGMPVDEKGTVTKIKSNDLFIKVTYSLLPNYRYKSKPEYETLIDPIFIEKEGVA